MDSGLPLAPCEDEGVSRLACFELVVGTAKPELVELGMAPELDEVSVASLLLDAACERPDEELTPAKEFEEV